MPIVRDANTGVVQDLPQNIIDHPILGASLEPWPRVEVEAAPVPDEPAPEAKAPVFSRKPKQEAE